MQHRCTAVSTVRQVGHRRCMRARAKMYVPSDSFGGISPERKASQALQQLFTFIAAKIVLAQLEGSGRGSLASYNYEQYNILYKQLQDSPLTDAHSWLNQLMQKDRALALRLMVVRDAYCKEDFEWDQLQHLSHNAIKDSNIQLMRQAATASLIATENCIETQHAAGHGSHIAVTALEQQDQRSDTPDSRSSTGHADSSTSSNHSSSSDSSTGMLKEHTIIA
eukprot:GHRR01034532.1.p1 GENE.GHRR01034532.1~~GHRR01034532.1.p1  ORF type:complete len:222 (+),score=58.06 GHRR01034532.1:131-796(+)